ncbi:hypothetical protein AFCA_005496 [Aspergillus flavus]|nr:hypothetical protein AFCA_005496 [Aspergillus flavus]
MYRKDPEFYARFGFPGALGAETNPLIHQRQRKELEPFFSSKGVEACYPKIWAKVDIMCQGLQQRQAAGESVELVYLFKRLTLDVIYLLAFEIDLLNTDRVQTGKVVDDVALSTTLVYLCKCPKEMVKLRHEVECLRETNVQDIQLATISQIPYLDAVIREANRLSSPLSTVLPREVPSTGYVIGGHFLPKGTIVGFHLDDINRNPKFFPEPNEFIPERWSGEEGKKLQRWFVPFSKCSRRCIGMDFALVEMKLVVAAIISRFEIWLDNPNVSLNSREMLVKIPGDDLRIRLREITF